MTIDPPAVESPQASVLNYSIITISSDEESEERIVLKLRVSENTKSPVVKLQRLNTVGSLISTKDPITSTTRKSSKLQGVHAEMSRSPVDQTNSNFLIPSKENGISSSPKKREFQETALEALGSNISPISSPNGKFQLQSMQVILENLSLSVSEEVLIEEQKMKHGSARKENIVSAENIKSPRKIRSRGQSIDYLEYDIELTPTKRAKALNTDIEHKTPKKLNQRRGQMPKGSSYCTPTKKTVDALSPQNKQSTTPRIEANSCTTTPCKNYENEVLVKRSVRTPLRFRGDSRQLTQKVNLDESFRRSVLKCKLNLEGIKRKTTPRRSARKSTYLEYFTDSDEDLKEKEEKKAFTKSVTQSPLKRSRKLRYNSSSSDEDHEIVPTTPHSKRKENTPKTPNNKAKLISPLKRSRKLSSNSSSSDEDQEIVPTTPQSKRKENTPKTPKNRAKLIRDGVITPSMHSRVSLVPNAATPLMKARSALHVSYVPTTLPCREKEYCDIYNFLEGKLLDGCGGCMYISGVPGTGKTATVTSVINMLQKKRNIREFKFVNINGMRLTEPRQSYVEIWKQLENRTVPWEQAQGFLDDKFTKTSKQNGESIVMLIDELDILCTKRQDVVYNLLDWPTKAKNQLIVIAIANTMDLPERLLMSRVTSRLGLTRLTFQAYNYKQLQEIVTKRLSGTDSFNPDAIQLVARKVASVSGDARRALDICRRGAEMAEEEGKGELVNVAHINEALNAMITQPTVMAIKRCSRLEKLILQAIVAEVERTGVEETTFVNVFQMLVSCCALDGFKMVSSTFAQRSITQLNACRLILTDQKCNDIYQRIILNVSVHDVYFALKKSKKI